MATFLKRYWKFLLIVVLLLFIGSLFSVKLSIRSMWKCSSEVAGLRMTCQPPQTGLGYGIGSIPVEIHLVGSPQIEPLGYLKDNAIVMTVSADDLPNKGVLLRINIPKEGLDDPGLNNSITIGVIATLARRMQRTPDPETAQSLIKQIIREWSDKPFILVSTK